MNRSAQHPLLTVLTLTAAGPAVAAPPTVVIEVDTDARHPDVPCWIGVGPVYSSGFGGPVAGRRGTIPSRRFQPALLFAFRAGPVSDSAGLGD